MMIEQFLKESKTYNPLAKGSIKEAEKMLYENETVIYAINANISIIPNEKKLDISKFFSLKNKLNGVLAITNKRIFFCNKTLGNKTSKEINLGNIESIDDSSNALFGIGQLRIQGITEMFVIDTKANLIPTIKERLNHALTFSENQEAKKERNNYDELFKLKKLLDDNIISQEEFESEKEKILNK